MMDYHSIHGHDISSFDAPGTHRLPTVSATQALDDLKDTSATHVSTGLDDFDNILLGSGSLKPLLSPGHGGVKRGEVTEIWGPPGSGKTALGIQIASNALCDGDGVVWVDCFQKVCDHRIAAVLQAVKDARGPDEDRSGSDDGPSKLTHYACMTLPHLLALISRPTGKSIAADVSLVVISSMSALLNSALPKSQDVKTGSKVNKGLTLSAKRLQALRSIMDSLRKLAATKNCAVVVLSQCATQMQSERGPTLVAAVNATVWEQGVSTRIVLFKDWIWQRNEPSSVFLAGIQKLDGRVTHEAVEHVSAFRVEVTGVSGVQYDANPRPVPTMAPQKRKLGQTNFEIPDSEDDEDYGWADEDEAVMPPQASQWQGSEDILLGQEVGRSEDDTGDEADRHGSGGEAAESDAEERLR